MRKALLLALLMLLVTLAGCSGESPPAGEEEDDEGRTSDGGNTPGSTNNTDPPHDKVQVFEGPFESIGQGSQTYDVTVPANVTVVDFSLAWTSAAVQRVSLMIALDGCGSFSDATISGVVAPGGGGMQGRLCKDASAGKHTLTVEAQGLIQGATIRLTGQIPKANETAPA